jgi:hypothetical protein
VPAAQIQARLLLGRQPFQGRLDHLDGTIQKALVEVQLSNLEQDPRGLDGVAADPEEHRGTGQQLLGLREPALILAQGAFKMIDLGQHERIGDGLAADDIADVLEKCSPALRRSPPARQAFAIWADARASREKASG